MRIVRSVCDRVLTRARRLKAGIARVRHLLVENLQGDLHDYLNAAFAALQAPTTDICALLGGCVLGVTARRNDSSIAQGET